jgi:DNA-binding transcriptional ArsR family regulator
MDTESAILTLAALAQSTRLDVFRYLAGREPDGASAGEIARAMAVPHNTMSSHLAILARAGLVSGQRRSRSIVYRASVARLRDVTLFLVADCCGGRPEQCAPLVAEATARAPKEMA